ncbi:membrane associated rhomboid family serine protease [Pseudochelatococcus lubricantis]|uniref:Membrane associated rhomboid family serine protease n=1 Tax=Pseudochelatococcus lubricantis TaxID=1538102 RepID=A0ABX0UZ25_9HYPH|nr:membrane associated rhomboid family serine protease [Pseudochelatococcus lubricantis]
MSDLPPPDYRPDPYPRRAPAREPIVNAPTVIVAIIAALVLVHGLRSLLSGSTAVEAMLTFAFIPARLTLFFDPAQAQAIVEAAVAGGGEQMALTRYVLSTGSAPWAVLTYGLLHASWMHLAFNALWLLAFGTPVARRFGTVRFLVLFVLSSVAGALLYWLMRPDDVLPMVGASGAISGVMAAASRFVFSGGGAALFGRGGRGFDAPAQPLIALLENRQALAFIVAWFVINLLAGFASGIMGAEGAIAWEAHIGGFLAGLVLFLPLDPVSRRRGGQH